MEKNDRHVVPEKRPLPDSRRLRQVGADWVRQSHDEVPAVADLRGVSVATREIRLVASWVA